MDSKITEVLSYIRQFHPNSLMNVLTGIPFERLIPPNILTDLGSLGKVAYKIPGKPALHTWKDGWKAVC